MIRVDRIIIGIIWGVLVWPELRETLMNQLFCNPSLQNDFSESLLFGLGYCRFIWIIFYVVFPAITIISFWPWIRQFIEWILSFRN